ncbi:MAG: cobalamin-dependent protein [Desulfobacterales bacterium]|nr:cobalamin-dependent protein [Desulfobacterales bacterium]MBF0397227.1 cobalamin-dependent protein [Desulfobacterales bacterium]
MKLETPQILLVNPWIHDFAAYDFWAKPMGILTIASILRQHGFKVNYIDCTNRFHPNGKIISSDFKYGRGSYLKTPIQKPKGMDDVPRTFSRYGIKPEWFKEDLNKIPKPDLILVTSIMSYWYSGVKETIDIIKEIFSNTKIILGGIYATLCHEHAKKNIGADEVISGPCEKNIISIVEKHTNFSANMCFNPLDLNTYPYPAFDLQQKISYVPLITLRGCPFSCPYCASNLLSPKLMSRAYDSILEEIIYWHKKYDIIDFVFYDDALLFDAENRIIPLLEKVIAQKLPIRFHTPNAIHIKWITKEIANLFFKANFKTIRLGLETAINDERIDIKVKENEFDKASSHLLSAGFTKEEVGAYILAGLPYQSIESIKRSVEIVKKNCITPIPAYYTPIPNTELWKDAVSSSRYDLESDPIFTNNAILPCRQDKFSWKIITDIKVLAHDP